MKRAFLLLALLLSMPALSPAGADDLPAVQISRFSEKPVPRFESLKFGKVRGRKGPGQNYDVRFEYNLRGAPVLILKESDTWRYVQDQDGDHVWIAASQLSERRTAIAREAFTLKAGRAADSADVALVGKDRLVELGECDATQCQITADRYRGWAPRALLWGATATKG